MWAAIKRWLGGLAAFLCLILASPIIFLVILIWPVAYYWQRWSVNGIRREFTTRWGSNKKKGILVYSNSPHWKAYIDQHWVPTVGEYFVIMNWSEKTNWQSSSPFETSVFRKFAGNREFNPLAIIFPEPPTPLRALLLDAWRRKDLMALLFPTSDVEVIRFWRAFRDFKHGRNSTLRAAERKLFIALGVSTPPPWHAAA